MEEKSEHPNRRTNKPLMEKRRRARINTCLGELKTLVLMALNKDNSQFSKLEKADILEMAVKYLRHVQTASIATHAMDSVAVTKYRLGYGECAREVLNCLGQTETLAEDLRRRVSDHLSKCLYGAQTVTHSSNGTHIIPNYCGESTYSESPDIGLSNFSRHHFIASPQRPVVDTPHYVPRQFHSLRTNYSLNKPLHKEDFKNEHGRRIKVEPERNQQFEIDTGLSRSRQQTPKCKPSATVSSPESTSVTETNNSNVIDKSSGRHLHQQRKEVTKKRKATDCDNSESDTETNSRQDDSKHRRLAEDLGASGDKSDDESVWRPW